MNPLELLYEAIASEHGIIVRCSDPVALKNKLYPLRKNDEALLSLSFITSPTNPNGELWIIKRPEKEIENVG